MPTREGTEIGAMLYGRRNVGEPWRGLRRLAGEVGVVVVVVAGEARPSSQTWPRPRALIISEARPRAAAAGGELPSTAG